MEREIHSASIVIVLLVIATAFISSTVDATAATHALPAQTTGAAAPAAGDACSLMSKQDATAALGGTVTGPKSVPTQSMGPGSTVSGCGYSGAGYLSIQLNLMQLSKEQAAIYKGLCEQKGKEGLTGLGEVACWYDNKHEELQVLKGTTFFSIELRGKTNPTETIKAAAKKVFDQLK